VENLLLRDLSAEAAPHPTSVQLTRYASCFSLFEVTDAMQSGKIDAHPCNAPGTSARSRFPHPAMRDSPPAPVHTRSFAARVGAVLAVVTVSVALSGCGVFCGGAGGSGGGFAAGCGTGVRF
jgi:hypothetical protein